jgi:hypothetical protein
LPNVLLPNVLLSNVILPHVIMLNAIMLSIVMVSVVGPCDYCFLVLLPRQITERDCLLHLLV